MICDTNKISQETEDDEHIPKGWVDGYKHTGTVQEREATVQKIIHAQMMKYCLKKFQVSGYFIRRRSLFFFQKNDVIPIFRKKHLLVLVVGFQYMSRCV